MKIDLQQIKQRFGIIGNSVGLNRAIDVALQVAPTDLSVLITGDEVDSIRFFDVETQLSDRKVEQVSFGLRRLCWSRLL